MTKTIEMTAEVDKQTHPASLVEDAAEVKATPKRKVSSHILKTMASLLKKEPEVNNLISPKETESKLPELEVETNELSHAEYPPSPNFTVPQHEETENNELKTPDGTMDTKALPDDFEASNWTSSYVAQQSQLVAENVLANLNTSHSQEQENENTESEQTFMTDYVPKWSRWVDESELRTRSLELENTELHRKLVQKEKIIGDQTLLLHTHQEVIEHLKEKIRVKETLEEQTSDIQTQNLDLIEENFTLQEEVQNLQKRLSLQSNSESLRKDEKTKIANLEEKLQQSRIEVEQLKKENENFNLHFASLQYHRSVEKEHYRKNKERLKVFKKELEDLQRHLACQLYHHSTERERMKQLEVEWAKETQQLKLENEHLQRHLSCQLYNHSVVVEKLASPQWEKKFLKKKNEWEEEKKHLTKEISDLQKHLTSQMYQQSLKEEKLQEAFATLQDSQPLKNKKELNDNSDSHQLTVIHCQMTEKITHLVNIIERLELQNKSAKEALATNSVTLTQFHRLQDDYNTLKKNYDEIVSARKVEKVSEVSGDTQSQTTSFLLGKICNYLMLNRVTENELLNSSLLSTWLMIFEKHFKEAKLNRKKVTSALQKELDISSNLNFIVQQYRLAYKDSNLWKDRWTRSQQNNSTPLAKGGSSEKRSRQVSSRTLGGEDGSSCTTIPIDTISDVGGQLYSREISQKTHLRMESPTRHWRRGSVGCTLGFSENEFSVIASGLAGQPGVDPLPVPDYPSQEREKLNQMLESTTKRLEREQRQSRLYRMKWDLSNRSYTQLSCLFLSEQKRRQLLEKEIHQLHQMLESYRSTAEILERNELWNEKTDLLNFGFFEDKEDAIFLEEDMTWE